LFGLLQNTVTKLLFQFLEFNLQDCFHICVFHVAWPMLSSDMSYLLYWSVSRLWLWSQLVFETGYCYQACNISLWLYKHLWAIFTLMRSTRKGMQAQNILNAFEQNLKCERCQLMLCGKHTRLKKCMSWLCNYFTLIQISWSILYIVSHYVCTVSALKLIISEQVISMAGGATKPGSNISNCKFKKRWT